MRILCLQPGLLYIRPAALTGIFLAVDWTYMRRVAIEIRSPDPKLVLVGIDPFPQLLALEVSLHTGVTPYAHEIGRKPVAIAAAAAPAMV